jgi:membrane protease YdiL (CAAX protease family)
MAATAIDIEVGPAAPAVAPDPAGDAAFSDRWSRLKSTGWLIGMLLSTALVGGWQVRLMGDAWTSSAGVWIDCVQAMIILAFVVANRQAVTPLLKLPRFSKRSMIEMIAIPIGTFALMAGYFALLESIGAPLVDFSEEFRQAGWPVWSMFVSISLAPALFEELAFRGVIQSNLSAALGPREALFIQAALFSALHLSPLIFPSHFMLGLALGVMRLRAGSLLPGMALHGTWNALVLAQELAKG